MSTSSILFTIAFYQLMGLSTAGRSTVHSSTAAYNAFRAQHRNGDAEDTVSYAERFALFQARSKEVAAHNAQGKSWTMTVNHFADHTPGELQAMLGYKRVGGRWSQATEGSSSFLQTGHQEHIVGHIDVSSLAKTVDWTRKMNFSNFLHNQGSCGSCWAHAAVASLEAHAELATGMQIKLATQEIIDCTANPRECGGTGGCHGATAELAFQEARGYGIPSLDTYKGTAGKCERASSPALYVKHFVRLPENKASHVLYALANKGPVVMSVDAGNLFMYNSGVFAGCQPDTVVNHAVLGVGYGADKTSGKDYWLIKNSWGTGWGEKGYIRLERFNDDAAYCGIDTKPQEGVYCKDHPANITVCGMCGATSDSAYPVLAPASKTSLRQQKADTVPNYKKVLSHMPGQQLLSVF